MIVDGAHIKPVQPRIVLVLQGEHGYWLKVSGDQVVDVHTGFVSDSSLPDSLPPDGFLELSGDRPVAVELILDTTMDEVDRVAVVQSTTGWINRYRQWMTLHRVQRDYRQAKAYTLPSGYHDQVAALMHIIIPERWAEWLLIVQGMNIVFHRVATGVELAAAWSRCLCRRTLVIMPVADYQRHLLMDEGAVVFLRTAKIGPELVDVEIPDAVAIEQTLEYLSEQLEVKPESLVVMATECLALGCEGRAIPESVFCLAAMLMGSPITVRSMAPDGRFVDSQDGMDTDLRKVSRAQDIGTPSAIEFLVGSGVLAALSRCITRFQSSERQWALLQSSCRTLSSLAPSVEHLSMARRMNTVIALSVLCVLMAVLCIGVVVAKGVNSSRLTLHSQQQRLAVGQRMQSLYAQAGQLHQQPNAAAESLLRTSRMSIPQGLAVEQLFERVGAALTSVQDISLDAMTFMSVKHGDVYESLNHALDSVPPREGIDTPDSMVTRQLELGGTVGGSSLQYQQQQLRDFADALRNVPGAITVNILDSPADSALTSEFDVSKASHYRVSVQLGQ